MRAVSACGFLILVAACQTSPPEAPPLDRQAIIDEVIEAADAWLATGPANDLEGGLAFFVDDLDRYYVGEPGLFVNRLQIYPTKERVLEVFRPSIANRSGTHYNEESGSFAVLSADVVIQAYRGPYNITNLEGETGPDYPMTASIVWVREEDGWKILHYHQSWSTDIE